MDVLAALLPPVVVGGAFVAIIVAVKRRADVEEAEDREREREIRRESGDVSPE